MGLITKEVEVKVTTRTAQYFQDKGYHCINGDNIMVNVHDLKHGMFNEVTYQCDSCKKFFNIKFKSFITRHELDGETYCVECANKIRVEKDRISKMKYIAHDGEKTCKKCGRTLPANTDYFHKKEDTYDGFTNNCKECMGREFTNKLTHIPKEGYKFCKKCDRELPCTSQYFPVDAGCKDGLRNICRECNDHYGKFLPDDYIPTEKWSKEDLELLKSIYRDYTNEELVEQFFPNRTKHALDSMANVQGFNWKTEETKKRSRLVAAKKTSLKLTGRPLSPERYEHLQKARDEYYKTHDGWWKGKKRSPEQCAQISQRMKGKWSGDKNPRHLNPLNGEANGRWLGGITDFYRELRSDTKDWFNESMEFCNYHCVITGGEFDNIHHTTSFRDIVDETFTSLNKEIKPRVCDYNPEEFDLIRTTLKELHTMYGYGACLHKDVHKLYHDNYGYTKFSPYDFLDFVYRIDIGEFDDWFNEHNLSIEINYNYIEYLESTLTEIEQSA